MMGRFSVRLALVPFLFFCLGPLAQAAEKIELRGHDRDLVETVNRRGLQRESSNAVAHGLDGGRRYLHAFRGEVLGLGVDDSFHAFREQFDQSRLKHIRYRQLYKGIPVFARELILHEEPSGTIRSMNGSIVKGIGDDLDPNVPLRPDLSPTEALDQAKNLQARGFFRNQSRETLPQSAKVQPDEAPARFSYRNEQSELNIYIDGLDKPRLVYFVSFYAEPDGGGEPTRPQMLLDARTGQVLKQWEGLAHQSIGTGPGGNAKVGQYEYGTTYSFLDVAQDGAVCSMQNGTVTTVDMTGQPSGYVTPFSYNCPRNTVKTVNGAYSPLNDAHYFGNIIVNMYTTWYGAPPIPLPLVMRPHYGTNYENAFWDGQYMTFGDGYSQFYPLVSLDVAAHEVSHGFTEYNSNLIYEKQSGGINESFSDMAGEAAEFFMRGSNDWKVGADIVKGTGALRYMDNPPADGVSIADYLNYGDSLDVHYSSGLFNRAFYLLATKPGWNIRQAFDVMVKANRDYWIPDSTFRSAACGAVSAATDLSYNANDVDDAFRQVNVYCGAPEIGTTVLPPAMILGGAYTLTGAATPFRQTFSASGGTSPYSWSIIKGSLPAGLTLDGAAGTISGTPAVGSGTFTLQIVDAAGRKNFITWTIIADSGLRSGWPKELQLRAGAGMLPESYSPTMADLDGDGRDEIIVTDVYTLYVFFADGTMNKTVLPGRATTPVVADLDGDGRREIIVSVKNHTFSTNSIYAFRPDLTPVAGFPAGAYATVNGSPGHVSSPLVADFNNDGQLKIAVIASPSSSSDPNYDKEVIIMVDSHGQMVAGWPQITGKFFVNPGFAPFDAPLAAGDLDRDGRKELVFISSDGNVYIFRPDGILLDKWQMAGNPMETWAPVLADVDVDGYLDIVAKYTTSAGTAVAVFNRRGELLPGWPKKLVGAAPMGPVVADVDDDGLPELVVVSGNGWSGLLVLKADGTTLPGWPVVFPEDARSIFSCYPIVADINGDGAQEILVNAVVEDSGRLLAYTASGSLVPGFPKHPSPDSEVRSAPVIGDLDGNGRTDIIVKSENGLLFAWEMDEANASPVRQWPMYRRDDRHSAVWLTNRPALSPSTRTFPDTVAGAASPSRTITVFNPLYSDVVLSSVSLTGSDSGMFSVNPGTCGPLPVTLPPLQSCTVTATFTPTTAGTKAALLVVASSSPGLVPARAPLTGTGMLADYRLRLTRAGGGSGTVTSSTGTTYTASGSEMVPFASTVVLTAAPAVGSVFTGWDGACSGIGTCTVNMGGDRDVTATFENTATGVHELTIVRSGPGSSPVTYSPGGECSSQCSRLYARNAVVTLTASSRDSLFSGWSGCDSVSGTTCTVTMTGARTVTATHKGIMAVSAGGYHSVALKADGTVWTWGSNNSGQLGDGTGWSQWVPVQATGLTDAVAVSATGWHTAALKSDGTVWTWGFNNYGGLGDGTTDMRLVPGQVPGLSGMMAIATGYFHTVALKSDGTVWSWGYNSAGQLGDGTTTNRTSPVQVPDLSGVVQIAAGDHHTFALKGDGTLWAWGSNSGQLGDGSSTTRLRPVQVSGISGIAAISSGSYHTLALKQDGTIWGWGYNAYGQVGDGTVDARIRPVQLSGVAGAVAVGSGEFHSMFAGTDGLLRTWGRNDFGQLGDGGTAQHASPLAVAGLAGIIAADGGERHSVALKGDGSLWSWGSNSWYQIGDGTSTDRPAPVPVSGLNLLPAAVIHGVPRIPTTGTGVTLSVDGSSIVAFKYRVDSGEYSAETPVAVPIALTSLGQGPHTIAVIGKDSAGIWQVIPTTASWIVDLAPPATVVSPAPGRYTDSVTVALSCDDGTGGGCKAIFYCLGTGCTPTTLYSAPITIATSTDIRFYSTDSAGNSGIINSASYTIAYALTVTASGSGSGTVTGNGISCTSGTAAGCSGTFDRGTVVTLTATAEPGSSFTGWSATCSPISGNECSVTMTGGKTVTATFTALPPVTTVNMDPPAANGANGWYTTIPTISLTSNPAGATYYRWGETGDYAYSTQSRSWTSGGTPLNIRGDDTGAWYDLPFAFSFYGTAYTRVYVSSNGLLRFDTTDTTYVNSGTALKTKVAIAPLWDDLNTGSRTGDDVYVFLPDNDSVGFRWQAVSLVGSANTNFETVLYRDGRIRFNYDAQGGSLTPTIGLSRGDGINFHLPYDNNLATTNAMDSILYTPNIWNSYGGPITPASGDTVLNYYSVDSRGAAETRKSLHIKVDTAAPATTASVPGGSYDTGQSVDLSCSDGNSGSGCDRIWYCLGSDCTPTTPYGGSVTIALSTDLRFSAGDMAGNRESTRTITYTILATDYAVNLTVSGTGSGSVISTPAGIACNTSCSTRFAAGIPVSLQADADPFSVFTGWSGACGGSTECALSMAGDRNVTATFDRDTSHRTRIGDTLPVYYPTIQAAYNGAAKGNVIRIWGTDFPENLFFDQEKDVVLSGGYDESYTADSGMTTVHGTLEFSKGTVTIKGLQISP